MLPPVELARCAMAVGLFCMPSSSRHKIKRCRQTIKDVQAPEEEGQPRHNKHCKYYKSCRPRFHDRSTLHTCGHVWHVLQE